MQFADLFYTGVGAGNSSSYANGQIGYGLNTAGTSLSFAQGDMRQSGNALDVAVNGQGFFITRDADGNTGYTRVGSFKFDTDGMLVSSTNGTQVMALTDQGELVALAWFDSQDAVAASGDNTFEARDSGSWHVGHAGTGVFGKMQSGFLEMSNVNLSQEFSDLVVMQRGYQASSQVISTANDMIQQLFSIKK